MSRRHLSSSRLVAPFPGVFIRRAAAYWVLLHLMRAVITMFAAGLADEPVPLAALVPGGNPPIVVLVVGLGMLQARRGDEDLIPGQPRVWVADDRRVPARTRGGAGGRVHRRAVRVADAGRVRGPSAGGAPGRVRRVSITADTLLSADSIGKRFGERKVLSAATLHADRGVVTALVGRNGSGKSTLLRIMAGLMAPDHGHLRFRGQVYRRTHLPRLARDGVFLLPADRSILVRTLTFGQQVDALRRRFDLHADDEVLEALKITHLLDRSPDSYSGGERRRAELALAIIRAPACLLADEPFLGITPADTEVFIAAFRRLAERGTAVIVTGHEVPFILAVADRVTWIHAGTTRPLGDPESARGDWLFRRDYLGIGVA